MTGSAEQKRLPKGTLPPFLTLGDASDLALRLYEHGGGSASSDLLSQLAGNSVRSSTFVKKQASLKSYGLVSEQNNTITLTDLGLAIAAPTDPGAAVSALKAAFLRIDVFNRVYERHKGKLLPADEYLGNIVKSEFGIPRDVADLWVRSFKDGARTAGLLLERSDGKTQVRDAAIAEVSKPDASETPAPTLSVSRSSPRSDSIDVSVPLSASGHCSRFEVSGGRYAIFYVPDKITNRDAEKMKSALAGLSATIDSLVVDEGNV
jgi:hypothetical protein